MLGLGPCALITVVLLSLSLNASSSPVYIRYATIYDYYDLDEYIIESQQGSPFLDWTQLPRRSSTTQIVCGRWRHDGSRVVVKRFEASDHEEALREAQALALLDDVCGTMRLYDVVVDGAGYWHVVMQYFQGPTLGQYVQQLVDDPQVSCAQAVRDLMRVLGRIELVLAQFHQRGVIHVDIDPINVLIDHDGNVALVNLRESVFLFLDPYSDPESIQRLKSDTDLTFQIMFEELFQALMDAYPDEIHHQPVYRLYTDLLHHRVRLAICAAPRDDDALVGGNAQWRYPHFQLSMPLSNWMRSSWPVLPDDVVQAQRLFRRQQQG